MPSSHRRLSPPRRWSRSGSSAGLGVLPFGGPCRRSRAIATLSNTANSTSRDPFSSAHAGARRNVQANGTPRRKPRNSGGSPSGVSRPAPLATMKMKNTTMCVDRYRCSLARSIGRMSSADAPVVPTMLPSTAPSAKKRRVDERRPGQRATQADAARDREQRPEQRHERDVVDARPQQHLAPRGSATHQKHDHGRAQEQRQHQLVPVLLPEASEEQGDGRNQKQVGDERGHRPTRGAGSGSGGDGVERVHVGRVQCWR